MTVLIHNLLAAAILFTCWSTCTCCGTNEACLLQEDHEDWIYLLQTDSRIHLQSKSREFSSGNQQPLRRHPESIFVPKPSGEGLSWLSGKARSVILLSMESDNDSMVFGIVSVVFLAVLIFIGFELYASKERSVSAAVQQATASTSAPIEPKVGFVDMFEKLQGIQKTVAALAIFVTYVAISAMLIQLNSWLMHEDRFPFAPVLCSLHMATSFCGTFILYGVCPSLFTAMPNLVIDRWFLLKFVPLGACFAASIVLSNMSYQHLSVGFIQMLKECNVAFTYVLSLMTGIEKWSKTATILLTCITIFGVGITATGEIHFVWLGFFIQLCSQGFEVSKVVMQNLLMLDRNGASTKLDPLTTVLFMAPTCFVFAVILYLTKMQEIPPSLVVSHAIGCWPQLLMSCLTALVLNVLISITIATFNAVGFISAGIAKDIVIVLVSVMIMGEVISLQQIFGFSGAIVCLIGYSLFKLNKESFEDDNILAGFSRLFDQYFVDTWKACSSAGAS